MTNTLHPEILSALDEVGWSSVKELRKMVKINYDCNAHQESGAIRAWLIDMRKDGLVEANDDRQPHLWRRTVAGTTALAGK